MDAAGAEPALRDLEAAPLAQQDVLDRHAHVLELDLGVAVRRVVIAEHGQRPQDLHARRVARHQDHRLLLVARRVRIGLAHQDEDLAARVHRARGPPFAAVDDVAASPSRRMRASMLVASDEATAGSVIAKAERISPSSSGFSHCSFCSFVRVAHQHFHVAGVGRRAVEHLGRDRRAPHDLAERRVFEVGQAGAVFAFGQEQVPQPGRARLRLQLLHDRRDLPAVARLRHLPLEDLLGRIDLAPP